MTAYELMIKTNHHLIKDGELTDAQKSNIAGQLLAARSDGRTKQSFYKGVNAPEYLSALGKSSDEGRKTKDERRKTKDEGRKTNDE